MIVKFIVVSTMIVISGLDQFSGSNFYPALHFLHQECGSLRNEEVSYDKCTCALNVP